MFVNGQILAHYTSADLMVPQVQACTGVAVAGELCSLLERGGRVSDGLGLHNKVIAREKLAMTTIMPGWALPHARIKDASQLCFALGRSKEPLDWFGTKGAEVRLVFLFVIPENEAGIYLKVLSALAKLGQNKESTQKLLDAPDGQTMFKILRGFSFSKSTTRHEYSVPSTTV
jgi:mannitol/fructose-specific phosphotransferase system IIA component (Ntr-type)